MSTSVNTIKRLIWVMLGTLVLTYLISLNMENHFLVANTKWLSNDFLFAIGGGAFASLAIVLVCEVIRYWQIKPATEATLFANLGNLYGQFLIIRSSCRRALINHDRVTDNLIQPASNNAAMLADYINYSLDYTPFRNRSKTKEILTQYKTDKYQAIKSVLISSAYLQIAIREDEKVLLTQGIHSSATSDCPNVNKALNKVINQTTTILTYLDHTISEIDSELGDRYHWQDMKHALNTYQDNFTERHLDDYLKEDVIVF